MQTYYLYHLHPNGRIAGRDDLEAEDDVTAIALADQIGHGAAMELWLGARMVKSFAASGEFDNGPQVRGARERRG